MPIELHTLGWSLACQLVTFTVMFTCRVLFMACLWLHPSYLATPLRTQAAYLFVLGHTGPFYFFRGFVHVPLYLFTFTVYLFTSLSQSSALLPDLEPPRWWTSGPPESLHWPDQMRSPASRARQTQNQSCELLQTTSLTSYKHASLTNFQAFWPDLLVDVVEVLELFPRKFAVIHHIVAIHIQTFLHNSCDSKCQ